MLERSRDKIKLFSGITVFGLLVNVGCIRGSTDNQDYTSDSKVLPRAYSIDVAMNRARITRINSDTFMVTSFDASTGSWGGTTFSPATLSRGIDYMRSRGCRIIDVSSLAPLNIKVYTSNGEDCLPELK